MLDKLAEVEKRYVELEGMMSDPQLLGQLVHRLPHPLLRLPGGRELFGAGGHGGQGRRLQLTAPSSWTRWPTSRSRWHCSAEPARDVSLRAQKGHLQKATTRWSKKRGDPTGSWTPTERLRLAGK